MSDTNQQNCKCCESENDCINGVCMSCNDNNMTQAAIHILKNYMQVSCELDQINPNDADREEWKGIYARFKAAEDAANLIIRKFENN